MCFRQAQLPGGTRIADGGQRTCAGPAIVAGDGNEIRIGLGHTRSDGTYPRLGDQLYGDQRIRVDLLEVKDELCQILDGIDIVVRRR